jgi:hypothetical protein
MSGDTTARSGNIPDLNVIVGGASGARRRLGPAAADPYPECRLLTSERCVVAVVPRPPGVTS